MISKGYFSLNEEILERIYKKFGYRTRDFLYEMLIFGGRISYHEYDYWMEWLKKKIKSF